MLTSQINLVGLDINLNLPIASSPIMALFDWLSTSSVYLGQLVNLQIFGRFEIAPFTFK